MKYGLSEAQLQEIIAFIGQYAEVEAAVLFGSRAMDTYKEASTVEIALKGAQVTHELAAKMKVDSKKNSHLPFLFDFVAYQLITDEVLKTHIDTKGVVLCRRGEVDISEWKTVYLKDVVTKLGDGLHGTPVYDSNGEYFFINGNNLVNGKIVIKENTQRVSQSEYLKYKKELNRNSILLGINGTIGNVAIYNNEKCILGKSVCYFNVIDAISRDFIKYIIIGENFQAYIENFSNGTTIKNVSLKTVREYVFSLPPLPEQRAIAGVLSSLDDKIDLLHRQNKTLEAMAEALFRQWFIEEADAGWEEDNLLSFIELIGGGTPKTDKFEYWKGEIPWLSGGDIASNHKSFVLFSEKTISKFGLDNSATKLLPKYSTIISARGTVGKYCLLAEPMAFSQSNYGILPKIPDCFFFAYLLINHAVEELQVSAYGSVFDTITTNTFRNVKIKLPKKSEIERFESMVTAYFEKMLLNKQQIRILEKLRDSLLPKLMSGEVRVSVLT